MTDEDGYRSLFAKQGASASQVAAATLLDYMSKLLSDVVSAYTQVRIPEADCPERDQAASATKTNKWRQS